MPSQPQLLYISQPHSTFPHTFTALQLTRVIFVYFPVTSLQAIHTVSTEYRGKNFFLIYQPYSKFRDKTCVEVSRELCGRLLHFLARVKIGSWLSLAASTISGRFFPAAAVFLSCADLGKITSSSLEPLSLCQLAKVISLE